MEDGHGLLPAGDDVERVPDGLEHTEQFTCLERDIERKDTVLLLPMAVSLAKRGGRARHSLGGMPQSRAADAPTSHAMGWRSDDSVAWMGMRWRWPEVGNDRRDAVPVPVAIGGGWWDTVGICYLFFCK